MTIVRGLRIISSNAQTGTTWWNWTLNNLEKSLVTQNSPTWRKPKPKAEKQSELIGLRFTLSEYEQIKTRAGLIPIATYLKDILGKTEVFEK